MTDEELLLAEARELETLIESGISFQVGSRTFVLKQPYLGTLDALSVHYLAMRFDEKALEENPFGESKRLMADNAGRCARVLAIAVLNSYWKIKLLTPLLSWYFRWHVTPDVLFRLAIKINEISNIGAFTNSIRFLSVSRTTKPAHLIEKEERAANPEPTAEVE